MFCQEGSSAQVCQEQYELYGRGLWGGNFLGTVLPVAPECALMFVQMQWRICWVFTVKRSGFATYWATVDRLLNLSEPRFLHAGRFTIP